MITKVLIDQRLVDLCMQEYGDPSTLFETAQALGKSITDELVDIIELDMPVLETSATGKSILQVLKKPFNNPASADDSAIDITLPPGGIGFMKITYDFSVS